MGAELNGASLTRYAWISVAAAIATIALKTGAWWITGSVGLLSDAIESVVNLVAALVALWMLWLAERPPDEAHAHGYSKAEYFSSGLEGAMIFLAAAVIIWTAVPRLLNPRPLEEIGVGLAISVVASAINFGVSRLLMRAARRYESITLEADAHHLMTDEILVVAVVIPIAVHVEKPAQQDSVLLAGDIVLRQPCWIEGRIREHNHPLIQHRFQFLLRVIGEIKQRRDQPRQRRQEPVHLPRLEVLFH